VEVAKEKALRLPDLIVEVEKFEYIEFPVTVRGLTRAVKKGHLVLIEDGLYEGKAVSTREGFLKVKMGNAGILRSHKGLNFPNSTFVMPAITAKDKEDAAFAVQHGADWIAFSFARSAKDVKDLRRVVAHTSAKVPPRIMVKIERREAVENFEEILAEADGVMIARGDLGLEIPAADVPIVQKKMIELARLAGKPVIVATQMLASMEEHPRPTRAEVSDVANAVFDHADAVMLSGESANGKYPVRAVKTMAEIVARAEISPYEKYDNKREQKLYWDPASNEIFVEWLKNDSRPPYYICAEEPCSSQISIFKSKMPIREIDFFPHRRDLIMISIGNGVYALEIDGRGGRLLQPIYKGKSPDFAVFGNEETTYIIDEGNLIKIYLR